MPNSQNHSMIVIMGPTASGKSKLALRLAEQMEGEIVSADSMQVYRGLDIGTAKPSKDETAKIPHHLVDILDFHEELDVYRFVKLAEEAIGDIRERHKIPLVCGGTGFYLKALLYGLALLPGDKDLRRQLDDEFAGHENFPKLKELMSQLDPKDYRRWSQHQRKLIRALEVYKLTGKSITELQSETCRKLRYQVNAYYLEWDRDALRARINLRTSQMLKSGWIEEAERLIANGLLESPTARQALGYRIIDKYLRGTISYQQLEETISVKTWQFARRQRTWFRHQHPEAAAIPMPLTDEGFAAICRDINNSEL